MKSSGSPFGWKLMNKKNHHPVYNLGKKNIYLDNSGVGEFFTFNRSMNNPQLHRTNSCIKARNEKHSVSIFK